MASELALLLLADGRFPAGGHAHSMGVEAAVADGRVRDETTLESFVRGRLATGGFVDAAMAVATLQRVRVCSAPEQWRGVLGCLDAEANARITAPPLRAASRRLGRQLLRASARCWPDSLLADVVDRFPDGAHQSVALGVVAVVVDLAPLDLARLTLHHAAATPAQAGVRLLGLDPFAIAALLARSAAPIEDLARRAVEAAAGDVSRLPANVGPIVEIAAVEHARWDSRLFAT
jgi:urease accessory protein